MYVFDYRQRLMETISQTCQSQLASLASAKESGCSREDLLQFYYGLVAMRLMDQLPHLVPGRIISLSSARLLFPADQQYAICYRAITGREPRPRDCQALRALQQRLVAQILEDDVDS